MIIGEPVPLIVFISCSQKEFGEFRKHLKEMIDKEEFRFSGSRIMKAELIEERRGDVIPEDIKKGLKIVQSMLEFLVKYILSGQSRNISKLVLTVCLC
jgi:hypothetical protein